ncbi:hypothetical protein KHS38_01055 [Mucilaginibacter sp. Bleaf8]|uniref:OmpP1/FadL family transporter n=1 Tax=Mucilaginibacter sp. Bleaf8 TaxID=2834430 RepID=UPI001BCD3396|nr:hypothetical protein [Mucilaginibacter sp. Bleaf8]MBS7562977.1 hypothetical protein [Mucilaginibacter sp. Bleaf8]
MKIKYYLLVMATVAITKTSFAQYSQDAIRFSTFQTGSTSRIKAIGNAQMAVGGDLSSVSGNPAGLGFFTRSELSITPEFNSTKVTGNYYGQSSTGKSNQLNFNNASVVFYSRINSPRGEDKSKGWLSVNWGASYNRTNNFYQNSFYGGLNDKSSITDYYTSLANQALDNNYSLDGYLEGWAAGQGLIRYNQPQDQYESNAKYKALQNSNTRTEGGQTAYSFSMGANYSNKLYLGLGFDVTDLRYNSTNAFTEDNATLADFSYNTTYGRNQVTTGTGFNIRAGFIYKPVEAVRFGATVTTPTWYNVSDVTEEYLNTTYEASGQPSGRNGDTYNASYDLRTPFKVAGGLAIFIKKYGFITGDVEYLNYSTTRLSSPDFDVTDDNNDIRKLYGTAVNARVGAEARVTSSFYLRGGYGIQGSPLKNDGKDIKSVSGGLGYRFGSYYIDATYMHNSGTQNVTPYSIGPQFSPVAALKTNSNNAFLTVGLRF